MSGGGELGMLESMFDRPSHLVLYMLLVESNIMPLDSHSHLIRRVKRPLDLSPMSRAHFKKAGSACPAISKDTIVFQP